MKNHMKSTVHKLKRTMLHKLNGCACQTQNLQPNNRKWSNLIVTLYFLSLTKKQPCRLTLREGFRRTTLRAAGTTMRFLCKSNKAKSDNEDNSTSELL